MYYLHTYSVTKLPCKNSHISSSFNITTGFLSLSLKADLWIIRISYGLPEAFPCPVQGIERILAWPESVTFGNSALLTSVENRLLIPRHGLLESSVPLHILLVEGGSIFLVPRLICWS